MLQISSSDFKMYFRRLTEVGMLKFVGQGGSWHVASNLGAHMYFIKRWVVTVVIIVINAKKQCARFGKKHANM